MVVYLCAQKNIIRSFENIPKNLSRIWGPPPLSLFPHSGYASVVLNPLSDVNFTHDSVLCTCTV